MDNHQIQIIRGETPEASAVELVAQTLRQLHPICVAFSSGKDSSVLANIVITAAIKVLAEGVTTPIVVTHSDTGVENPIIHALARSEIAKMRDYAKANGLENFEVLIGKPSLSQSFAVRVIGGRAMPSYPSTRQDCSTDWKIAVQEKLRRHAMASFKDKGYNAPVVATGVRLGESAKRDTAIGQRREVGNSIWANDNGDLRLSPILDWEVDDIWTYLGLCNAGVIPSYSDFEATMDAYRDAGGSSCVVVADMAMAGASKPCTSRFGCWSCTLVKRDASLRQMIETDPGKYGFMQLLSDFRDFLANVQYDWSRRNYVGRSIDKDGYIAIAADGFSPALLADLLWYALSIQLETGVEIVSEKALIAIDARWSLYGLHRPFEALRIARRVSNGERRFPPKIPEYPKTQVPQYGKVFVGTDWNSDIGAHYSDGNLTDEWARRLMPTGLRSPLHEMVGEECGFTMRTLTSGRSVLDFESGPDMEVDEEGASDFLSFFADDLMDEYEHVNCDWTAAYTTYLGYGFLSVPKGQSWMVDAIMRRTQWRQRNGLNGERSLDELLARLDVANPRQENLFGGADVDEEDELGDPSADDDVAMEAKPSSLPSISLPVHRVPQVALLGAKAPSAVGADRKLSHL